jgi:hypothetical protein
VHLRLGVRGWLQPLEDAPPILRRMPGPLVARAIREFTLVGLYFDVAQDRRIWRSKRHVPHPVFSDGDGPIGPYRRWAAQFMVDERDAAQTGEGSDERTD